MRILVYAHHLEIGGSQRNAIDLATELRRKFDHEVVFYAAPGPMSQVLSERGIEWIPAPGSELSWRSIRGLQEAIAKFGPDVLHVWDHWQYVNAALALASSPTVLPMVVSDMISEYTHRLLPHHSVTTMGTPRLARWASDRGLKHVRVLTPPVDTRHDQPDSSDAVAFRASFGVQENHFLLVTVSRLEPGLKGESIRRTMEVAYALQGRIPVTFILVGDGPDREPLEVIAAEVNRSVGRNIVILAGEMLDPRSAYEAADLVVGMGGSAMRGMSLARPVLVCGAAGFAKLVAPETAEYFADEGTYGIGDGSPLNLSACDAISRLHRDRVYASEIGRYSREFCSTTFGLEATTRSLNKFLMEARTLSVPVSDRMSELARLIRHVRPERILARRVLGAMRRTLGMSTALSTGKP